MQKSSKYVLPYYLIGKLHKATPRSCVLDDCALLEEVQWSVGGTSVDVGITYMKRYGQFRNIFFTLDEYGDLFSLKEDEDHRRRKTVSPGIVIEALVMLMWK